MPIIAAGKFYTGIIRDHVYAKKIGSMTGYRLVYPGKNPSGGGFTDWFIEAKKKPGFTPEISRYVYETNPPLSEWSGVWKQNQATGLYTAQESAKLYDVKMKKETDKQTAQLKTLQTKAAKLQTTYQTNVKTVSDLKVTKTFKDQYHSVVAETKKLSARSAKLPAKYRSKLNGYYTSINTYTARAKLFMDGVAAGDKLVKQTVDLENRFKAGKLDQTTINAQKQLNTSVTATQETLNKMYGINVRTLAGNKYTQPAKVIVQNTGYEIQRYSLTLVIEKQAANGDAAGVRANLDKLTALENTSKAAKAKNPSQFKTYSLIEKLLLDKKMAILAKLAELEKPVPEPEPIPEPETEPLPDPEPEIAPEPEPETEQPAGEEPGVEQPSSPVEDETEVTPAA